MLLQPYLCITVHDESVPAGVDVNVSLVILSDVLKKNISGWISSANNDFAKHKCNFHSFTDEK